jgi:hypothetical protein
VLVLFSTCVLAEEPKRTPRQVAEQLAAVYGQKLDQVAYIPALPLVAKLRLSELTGEARHAEQVEGIVGPFLRGEKSPVPKPGSEQAGHLIFAALASRAEGKDRERRIALCRAAADQIFDKDGQPQPLSRKPQAPHRLAAGLLIRRSIVCFSYHSEPTIRRIGTLCGKKAEEERAVRGTRRSA